ncbi:MAG: UDP-N-acetylglucosamine 2-epimerase (non-hydrolyzing) [Parachlamydiaceae bacterium]|nr:UDP-N-acetylglucosamine 2-epimerase (non-hydrolyzing) [Parachlamydiaceae bacterium]
MNMFFRFSLLFFLILLKPSFSDENSNPVLLVVGTRPEAIKMLPLYLELKAQDIPTVLCSTGQHGDLLRDIFDIFKVKPDIDLNVMKPQQNLFYLTEIILKKMQESLEIYHPSLVVVQGDTTTAMTAALAAFYAQIPVAHIEAGLRTGCMSSPFPEEMNRRVISLLSTLHFAPTTLSQQNLLNEGIDPSKIFCTGNTVVDALYLIKSKIENCSLNPSPEIFEKIDEQKRKNSNIILLTAHRRESLDEGLAHILKAVKQVLEKNPNVFIIYPIHPNPKIKKIVDEIQLNALPNILITQPLPYNDLIYVLNAADGIATDSGGIHEEGVSLGKPVIVLRNETDRPEGLQDDRSRLVGTHEENVLSGFQWLLQRKCFQTSLEPSPYGDGKACQRITQEIKFFLTETKRLK